MTEQKKASTRKPTNGKRRVGSLPPKIKGLMTITAYATHVGVEKKTIMNAIKSGHLGDGVTEIDGFTRIIPDLATASWKKFWKDAGNTSNAMRAFMEAAPVDAPTLTKKDELISEKEILEMKRPEAERLKAAYAALSARINYQELAGEVVRRKDVYATLFELGQSIRREAESLPGKIVDSVMASKNRHAAMQVAELVVDEFLLRIADFEAGNIEITKPKPAAQ